MASIVSGDQSRRQHPAEPSHFSFTVWISTLPLSSISSCNHFLEVERIVFSHSWVCGESVFAALTEKHCFTSWLWRLRSFPFTVYNKVSAFPNVHYKSTATLMLSKRCVGRAGNRWPSPWAGWLAGTGSALSHWTGQNGCLMERKCCLLTLGVLTFPPQISPPSPIFLLPSDVSNRCHRIPRAPRPATDICSVWMQTWIIGITILVATFPPCFYPFSRSVSASPHLSGDILSPPRRGSFPLVCCAVGHRDSSMGLWRWIIGLGGPCQLLSCSLTHTFCSLTCIFPPELIHNITLT